VSRRERPEQVTAKSVYIGNLCCMLDLQTLRELGRASANVRTWTDKRNTLIREAHEAGGGVREIARATGLNVGTVHNILFGRKRGATDA
jgi:hypothetical protein